MISRRLHIIILFKRCILIVYNRNSCTCGTVRGQCRKGKKRFIQHIRQNLNCITGTSAADTKQHICIYYFRVLLQYFNIFIIRITAIPDKISNFKISAFQSL